MRRWTSLIAIVAAATFAAAVAAEPVTSGPITSDLQLYKVIKLKDGREQLDAAEQVKPGDLIEYRATYKNISTEPIQKLEPALPVPEGMVFALDNVRAKALLASIDGREFGTVPLTRTVQSDGREIVEMVPATEYRQLKWVVGYLGPGETAVVRARMRVVSTLKGRSAPIPASEVH